MLYFYIYNLKNRGLDNSYILTKGDNNPVDVNQNININKAIKSN